MTRKNSSCQNSIRASLAYNRGPHTEPVEGEARILMLRQAQYEAGVIPHLAEARSAVSKDAGPFIPFEEQT